jgi:hypothetical protein
MFDSFMTTPPEGFAMYQEWPEYNVAAGFLPFERAVYLPGMPGVRKGPWPLTADVFFGDRDPDTFPGAHESGPNRMQIWQRTFRTDVPLGWFSLSKSISKIEGFVDIRQPEYWANWSDTSTRYRNKWYRECLGKKYLIQNIDFETYRAAYLESTIAKKIHKVMLVNLEKRLSQPQGVHIECTAAKGSKTGEIVAGMAVIHSPTFKASYYQSGFYMDSVKKEPVMVGLFDDWFQRSKQKDFMYLHLGNFWTKGDPRSWKGFSEFKSKFGPNYIAFPPDLLRFKRGSLF